jgi:hypothetical protein
MWQRDVVRAPRTSTQPQTGERSDETLVLAGRSGHTAKVVDRVAAAMKVVSGRQDVRETLDKIAFELQSSTPEEMATLLKDQLDVYAHRSGSTYQLRAR